MGKGGGGGCRERQEEEGSKDMFHPDMRTEILDTIHYTITNTKHFLKTDSHHQIITNIIEL